MEVKEMTNKLTAVLSKYRYAALILVIGLALMLIPGKSTPAVESPIQTHTNSDPSDEEKLESVLSSIKGVGRVEVVLSFAAGERTVYQTDTDAGSQRSDTVTVTDADRNQTGLVTQVVPPVFQGAIIVCQGAGDPTVRLAIVDAVSKYTGLGANQISVLEMK